MTDTYKKELALREYQDLKLFLKSEITLWLNEPIEKINLVDIKILSSYINNLLQNWYSSFKNKDMIIKDVVPIIEPLFEYLEGEHKKTIGTCLTYRNGWTTLIPLIKKENLQFLIINSKLKAYHLHEVQELMLNAKKEDLISYVDKICTLEMIDSFIPNVSETVLNTGHFPTESSELSFFKQHSEKFITQVYAGVIPRLKDDAALLNSFCLEAQCFFIQNVFLHNNDEWSSNLVHNWCVAHSTTKEHLESNLTILKQLGLNITNSFIWNICNTNQIKSLEYPMLG